MRKVFIFLLAHRAAKEAPQAPRTPGGSMELDASPQEDCIARNDLERNADGDPRAARVSAVKQVVPIVDIHDINIVGLVPVISPEFRVRINHTEPIPAVLESREPANLHKGEAVDSERVA